MTTLKTIIKDAMDNIGYVIFAVVRHSEPQISMISDAMNASHLISNSVHDGHYKAGQPEDFLDDVVFTNGNNHQSIANTIANSSINHDPRSVPQQPKSFNPSADYADATLLGPESDHHQSENYQNHSNHPNYDVMDSPLPPVGYRDSPEMVEIPNKSDLVSNNDKGREDEQLDRSMSPEPDGSAFARDAPGRHSFSERHSCTRNAHEMAFYQKLKGRSNSLDMMGVPPKTSHLDQPYPQPEKNFDPYPCK